MFDSDSKDRGFESRRARCERVSAPVFRGGPFSFSAWEAGRKRFPSPWFLCAVPGDEDMLEQAWPSGGCGMGIRGCIKLPSMMKADTCAPAAPGSCALEWTVFKSFRTHTRRCILAPGRVQLFICSKRDPLTYGKSNSTSRAPNSQSAASGCAGKRCVPAR